MIVDVIRKIVKSECQKPTSKYGFEPYIFHFVPMVDYCSRLADELGADKEVVILAAWLHDIGSIIHGRKDHHISGARIAEEVLQKHDYDANKIPLIKSCIFNHRSSTAKRCQTIEEKIISDADAMSNFENIPGIFKAAFMYENLDQGEAKKAVKEKLKRKWQNLYLDNSKKIIRPKYEAAMLLLDN